MIDYDTGETHIGFICRLRGSTIPKAALFSLPSALLTLFWQWLLAEHGEWVPIWGSTSQSAAWSVVVVVLGMLLGFRTNKAYSRFWEGITLVQQMSAEWFEACSNLTAFSHAAVIQHPGDQERLKKVKTFQYTLVRLMSLMHGTALRQIGGHSEEFPVLDIHALDDESMSYLYTFCVKNRINPVEVLLHWIQVLITDGICDGVLVVPPPIVTRAFQTLSRGMVNLHDARKLADVPFPFPLSQMVVVLLIAQALVTPMIIAVLIPGYMASFITFLPIFGMWSVTFIAGQLEQPFGTDPNDLPLACLQASMNNSLLMLLDPLAQRAPSLKEGTSLKPDSLRRSLRMEASMTDTLKNNSLSKSVRGAWDMRSFKTTSSFASLPPSQSLFFSGKTGTSRKLSTASATFDGSIREDLVFCSSESGMTASVSAGHSGGSNVGACAPLPEEPAARPQAEAGTVDIEAGVARKRSLSSPVELTNQAGIGDRDGDLAAKPVASGPAELTTREVRLDSPRGTPARVQKEDLGPARIPRADTWAPRSSAAALSLGMPRYKTMNMAAAAPEAPVRAATASLDGPAGLSSLELPPPSCKAQLLLGEAPQPAATAARAHIPAPTGGVTAPACCGAGSSEARCEHLGGTSPLPCPGP